MPNRSAQSRLALTGPNAVHDARSRIEALFRPSATAQSRGSVSSDLQRWRSRRLEAHYALAFLDSLVVKVRDCGLLANKRVHLALGIDDNGTKDILGVWADDPKVDPSAAQIAELHARGVMRIDVVVLEGSAGLQAVRDCFPGAAVFPNVGHVVRRAVASLPAPERAPAAAAFLRQITQSQSPFTVLPSDPVRQRRGLGSIWRQLRSEITPVAGLPPALRELVCTTSAVESMVEKQRRRGFVKRNSFADSDSAVRDLAFVLRDANASWQVSPRVWAAVRVELTAYRKQQSQKLPRGRKLQ